MILSILNSNAKFIYCTLDSAIDILPNGHIAIKQIFTLENPDNKDIYFNFETQTFYLGND